MTSPLAPLLKERGTVPLGIGQSVVWGWSAVGSVVLLRENFAFLFNLQVLLDFYLDPLRVYLLIPLCQLKHR